MLRRHIQVLLGREPLLSQPRRQRPGHDDPFTLRRRLGLLPDERLDLPDAIQRRQLGIELAQSGAQRVDVRVDQPRQHRLPCQVH